jgi:hypothetical protein
VAESSFKLTAALSRMFANSLGLNRELQDGIAQRLKRHEQDGESDRAKEPIGGSSKQRRPLLLVAYLVLMQFGSWVRGACVGCLKIVNKP